MSICALRFLIECRKWLYAITAGIAVNSPAAVVTSASAMPGATARRLAAPASPSPVNASMIPHTVPNNPMNGVTDPVVASQGIHFSSFRTSPCAAACIVARMAFSLRMRPACGFASVNWLSTSFTPALYTATSGDADAVIGLGSFSFFRERNSLRNRSVCRFSIENRLDFWKITAQDTSEKESNISRTTLATQPVCSRSGPSCPTNSTPRSGINLLLQSPQNAPAQTVAHGPKAKQTSNPVPRADSATPFPSRFPRSSAPSVLPGPPSRLLLSVSPGFPLPYNLAVSSSAPLPHLRIHSINIYVTSQDAALRFYLDKLGFHLAYDARLQSGERLVAVAPPDGSAVLSLIAPAPDSREFKLVGRSSRIVFITDDVLAKFREWSARGVHFQFAPRLRRIKFAADAQQVRSPDAAFLLGEGRPVWGGVFTRFRDPDGNTFSLVSFDEVTHTLEVQRRSAAAKLEAERRAAQELEIAKEVQARLFPQTLPPLPSLEYSGVCIQARQVGGDYYDFLDLGPDRLGLVIGDISGKGIAAALLMANLQANLRSQCAVSIDRPGHPLDAVNQHFCRNTPDGAFATLFFADYHASSGRLRYANCGHLPALVLRATGEVARLEATSTVLGVFKDWICCTGELHLSPGDALALFTDGITESFNHNGEEFGVDRLVEALLRHRALPARDLLSAVVDEVRIFSHPREQHDDITLIIAKVQAPAPL